MGRNPHKIWGLALAFQIVVAQIVVAVFEATILGIGALRESTKNCCSTTVLTWAERGLVRQLGSKLYGRMPQEGR